MQVELDGIIYARSERYVLHCRRARAGPVRDARHNAAQLPPNQVCEFPPSHPSLQ